MINLTRLLSLGLVLSMTYACQQKIENPTPAGKSVKSKKTAKSGPGPDQGTEEENPQEDPPEGDVPDDEGAKDGQGEGSLPEKEADPKVTPMPMSLPTSTPLPMPSPMPVPMPTPATPRLSLLFTGNDAGVIEVHKFNRADGTASLLKSNSFAGTAPTFLKIDKANKRVYAVNEIPDATGGMMSFSLDTATGVLTQLSKVTVNMGTTHIAVDANGKFAFGASYGGNTINSFPIGADGKLGTRISSEMSGMNSHQALVIPGAVFVPALGSDQLTTYSVGSDGKLTSLGALALGGGPRHIALHPNGKWSYIITEKSNQLYAITMNGAAKPSLNGAAVDALTDKAGSNAGAEVQVHPNGKFVYASVRGKDVIAIFSVEADGKAKLLKNVPSAGVWPRHFSLDASGQWLFVAGQRGGGVAVFKVDAASGDLTKQAASVATTSPQYVELVDFD